jgi:hypothetical protein
MPRATAQAADRKEEPLAGQVRRSIERGVQYLRQEEKGKGHWEIGTLSASRPGGLTSLALLALLNAGVPPDDPIIQRGLEHQRTVKPHNTYVVGLQTMVFCLAGQEVDRPRIQNNVKWLLDARFLKGDTLLGWGYRGDQQGGDRPDHSCTQYALLGLHEAHQAGIPIPDAVWRSVRDFYTRTQGRETGGWGYIPADTPKEERDRPSLTMTTAGACGLLIAGMNLNKGREEPLGNGRWKNCGVYDDAENRPLQRALDLISGNFPEGKLNETINPYYCLYGIERTGRLSGQRFFGKHDWYRVGCKFLIGKQQADGSWTWDSSMNRLNLDRDPIVATSFSLLFLSKGRTPVLISKLAHGPDEDWNNDRNDARHLVEFASRELFKKQPLAWQVFDPRRVLDDTDESVKDVASDLLASPILYFNGHKAPDARLRGGYHRLLRYYVENGGFILAEACCGDERFTKGFDRLIKDPDVFGPNATLEPLSPEHPIWSAAGKKFHVTPNDFKPPLQLYGLQMGCKTVVVFSPQDLSCWWESNDYAGKLGGAKPAFNLAANIIAYATGLELPQDRGTKVEVVKDDDPKKIPRGALKVAQLRHGQNENDYKPAPRAMRNLMFEIRDLGLKVDLRTEEIDVNHPDIVHFKFLYMHGRNAFSFRKEDLEKLRFSLKHGGLLLADACCGSKSFDESFRKFIQEQLFPGEKLEPIPLTHELFSKELNGTAITKVQCRREGADGKAEPEFRTVDPFLEGIKVNGRWMVIYSKYDIGCALEKHPSSDCLGHDHASAVRLGKAVVLYALRR